MILSEPTRLHGRTPQANRHSPPSTLWRPDPVACAAFLLFAILTVMARSGYRSFDYTIQQTANLWAHHSRLFDHACSDLTRPVLSNVLFPVLLWYAWFETESLRHRATLLVGTLTAILGTALSRVFQHDLTSQPRPLYDHAFAFRLPYYVDPTALNKWSSFPSDHAVMYFALARMLQLVNRRVGWLAYGLAAGLSLVRVYLGYHSPTDILGGAALGILTVECTRWLARSRQIERLVPVRPKSQALFYAIAFFVCFGIGTLFAGPREMAASLTHFLHHG